MIFALKPSKTGFALLALLGCLVCHGTLVSQENVIPPGTVRLNLRGDTPLVTLVEYISQRLAIRFIYDDTLASKKINLQVPDDIPVENLLDLLQSALRINDLTMVPFGSEGLYRIVAAAEMPEVSVTGEAQDLAKKSGDATPVTQIFRLQRGDPTQIKNLITPFLTSPGANTIAIPANRTLIVTDLAGNLERVKRLIDLLDAESMSSSLRFVKVQHVALDEISDRITEILAARARTEGIGASTSSSPGPDGGAKSAKLPGLEIATEPRTNQLILIGSIAQIEAAVELLKSLDVPLATSPAVYRPQFITPKQLDEILRQWVDSLIPKPIYDSRIEPTALVVTTTESMQQQIARILPQLDSRETSTQQSPIRFYKIENVPVQDILETLNSLQTGGFGRPIYQGNAPNQQPRSRTTNDRAIPGPNNPNIVGTNTAQPGLVPPVPSAVRNGLLDVPGAPVQPLLGGVATPPLAVQPGYLGTFENYGLGPGPLAYGAGWPVQGFGYGGFPMDRSIQSPLGNAQVTADLGSNSLIIIAEPEVQQAYAQLIEYLDKRRPQVMIEAKIVIIDTTDDYTLGVEVSGGDRTGARRIFAFSSYGLSTVNPINGALAITPGQGFNATLVDPSTADVVVRALATHRRARVLSSPKILVDDNAEGTLTSVNEVPFTSVNASQTVATTSFAGFAEAGTTITVTPTISKAKHINLDYIVTLNSFTGTGSAGVPPPRQTNEISSRVTVPDGYTIIVGGLTQKNVSNTLNGFPYLEKIPLVRELTSLQSASNRDSSLFVFLRPVILEEDRFRDLRSLTVKAARAAGDGHNFPASSALWMK